ncbi:MAG TPA: hypothetical protein PLB91_03950 [Spirochaetales bacterium]|nr:hypothetical protein [Spirochaetales bacterium]HRY53454.1 multidrug transporter [Spirochaetia bacterium]
MEPKNTLSASFKDFNFKLYGTLILISLLPTLYSTVRIYFLGNLPNDWGFNIASQLAWVNIFYEVVQETLILPLFYIISKSRMDRVELSNKVRTGLISSFLVFMGMSILIIAFAIPLLSFMGQKSEILGQTADYIRLEAIAIQISVLFRFISIVLIILKSNGKLMILLAVQMVLTILSDIFLVSILPVSLKIGVNGIAIGNIGVNIALVIIGVALLRREGIEVISKEKNRFAWQKEWIRIGGLSGLESFVRNAIFTLMIIRMINMVQEQGTFWIANNFIWGWLLLPILALGELVKRNTAEDPRAVRRTMPAYLVLTTGICLIWLVTMPFWGVFIQKIMNAASYQSVVNVAVISIAFYIIFAYNNIVDNVFYGLGRTDLMLYQSLLVNTIFYGCMFIAYKTGIFIPTLERIAIMFGVGMAVDSVITFIMYWVLNMRNRLFTMDSSS